MSLNPNGTGLNSVFINSAAGFIDNQTTPQLAITHSWTAGSMQLRAGAELRRVNINILLGDRPTYNFTGFLGATGLLGSSASQSEAVTDSTTAVLFGVPGGPTTPMRGWRTTQQEYFVQADWRARRNVTFNLGLRYTDFGVFSEVNGAASNLYAIDSSGRILPDESPFAFGQTANTVAPVSADIPFYQPDRNNFQPRLGVAWTLDGSGTLVARAGYGIYHDRIYQLLFSNGVNNVPFATFSVVSRLPFQLTGQIPVNPAIPSVRVVDPAIRNPYTQRFNVALEKSLGNTSVSAAYVGSRASKLFVWQEVNGGSGVPQAARPDQRFSDIRIARSLASSQYDSLQLFANRRWSAGIGFTASYTYSRSLDNASEDTPFSILPALLNRGASPAAGFQGGGSQFVDRPIDADRGYSDFDMRHNLTISHVVDLPFGRGRRFGAQTPRAVDALIGGWTFSGIVALRSGEPFTVTNGTDYNDDGSSGTDRPVLMSGSLTDLYASGGSGRVQYLVPQATAQTQLGVPADVTNPFAPIARNAFRSPAVQYYDASLSRKFNVTETASIAFEANVFNVFNRAQFAAPNTAALSSNRFGEVTRTRPSLTPRQMQFGLKVRF
jgi:hypothetical protein